MSRVQTFQDESVKYNYYGVVIQDPLAVTWLACSHKAENPVVVASLER